MRLLCKQMLNFRVAHRSSSVKFSEDVRELGHKGNESLGSPDMKRLLFTRPEYPYRPSSGTFLSLCFTLAFHAGMKVNIHLSNVFCTIKHTCPKHMEMWWPDQRGRLFRSDISVVRKITRGCRSWSVKLFLESSIKAANGREGCC